MFNLRVAFPYPQFEILKVNKDGHLDGEAAPIFRDLYIYFFVKFNTTFTVGTREVYVDFAEAVEMMRRDEAGTAYGTFSRLNGLPENITHGSASSEISCRLISSSKKEESVLTDGPELALYRMNIEYLFMVCSSLILMFYGARMVIGSKGTISPAWFLFMNLMKQYVTSYKSLPFICFLLSSSTFLIQIIFSSLLNTERTSITSFHKMNTFKDAQDNGAKILVSDFSNCVKFFTKERDILTVFNFYESYTRGDNYDWCIGTRKCAIVASSYEGSMLRPMICILREEMIKKNSLYYSSALVSTLQGMVMSKNMSKEQKMKLEDYAYQANEMGLEQKNVYESRSYGQRGAKILTQIDPSEECMSKTMETGISGSYSLTNEFFKGCYTFCAGSAVIAILIFFTEIGFSSLDQLSNESSLKFKIKFINSPAFKNSFVQISTLIHGFQPRS